MFNILKAHPEFSFWKKGDDIKIRLIRRGTSVTITKTGTLLDISESGQMFLRTPNNTITMEDFSQEGIEFTLTNLENYRVIEEKKKLEFQEQQKNLKGQLKNSRSIFQK
jgi:hypothetical protein